MRHLELRGWQQRVRWTGPDSANLTRIAEAAPLSDGTKLAPAFVQERTIKQAEENLAQATREYLWLKTGERTQWRVTTKVPPECAPALAQRRNIETLAGGQAPWTGEQLLKIGYKHQGKTYQLDLPIVIDLPTTVVVTVRPMRRDEIIDAGALAYGPIPERMQDEAAEYFTDFSQLIGKQLRRSMSTGLPIPRSSVGEPIVISSGELVEIESVAGLISVKTSARALSGGAVGDLINVELISSKKRLAATVVGPLRVRVAGVGKVSAGSAATGASRVAPNPLAQVAPSTRD
jgi:flagella basal body P-ring formation protein FlgA